MPDWYPLMKAAKLMGVAPWELEEQHPAWKSWALSLAEAENVAERELNKQAQRRSK